MSQAAYACTTRRALFGGLAVVSAVASSVPAAALPRHTALTDSQRRLAAWAYETRGDAGLEVARHVIAAGYGFDNVEYLGVTGARPGETRKVFIHVTEGDHTIAFDQAGNRTKRSLI